MMEPGSNAIKRKPTPTKNSRLAFWLSLASACKKRHEVVSVTHADDMATPTWYDAYGD